MSSSDHHTIVVGSGIAGLFAALHASEAGKVTLVTKSVLEESNTRYAQGGIAVAIDDSDIAAHEADTIFAGAGLCEDEAVRTLCNEGPQRVEELIALGVGFDKLGEELDRITEGAHGRARVLHAGGDATGSHIERALAKAIRQRDVHIIENGLLSDIIVNDGRAAGIHINHRDGSSVELQSDSVILATGGAGQVFLHTTNPALATGDGLAAAFRAGAVIRDAEMYQFHPTALAVGDTPFLISEAVRGAGAVLRDAEGNAFMGSFHAMCDLAPRDVVARAIQQKMFEQGTHVVLDATSIDAATLERSFPTIDAKCKEVGLDWATTPIPVAPAAHYWMGGIATDLHGRTTVPGLFAVGEVASTGVHGANRLASNSLLEGIVFGARAGLAVTESEMSPSFDSHALPMIMAAGQQCSRNDIRKLMSDNVGVIRDAHGLALAAKQLAAWSAAPNDPATASMLTVANLIVHGAIAREESRGAHHRSDFPELATEATHISWSSC